MARCDAGDRVWCLRTMSDLHPCAKCGHERLYVISPFVVPNFEYANSTNRLPVAASPLTREDDAGVFELRVCAACGFSEWWAKQLDAIARAAVSPVSNVRAVSVTATYR